MKDGQELLALFVLEDKQNWVAWIPEGFYGASPGAIDVLHWKVNLGPGDAAVAIPLSAVPVLYRPDALSSVLAGLSSTWGLQISDLKAAQHDVKVATGSARAAGARLHVLTIGVNEYGENVKDLKLRLARRDAEDLAATLSSTQDGGLYAEVKSQVLVDSKATKDQIFRALDAIGRDMAGSPIGDVAVVMYSGHGATIGDQFYLVPYGADNSTLESLKSSAIRLDEFQSKIATLAAHGKVLVLMDACRFGGPIDGTVPAADLVRSTLAAANSTVLTSSSANELSREDEEWQHGAFTSVLLDALSAGDVDTGRNGVISISELTSYIAQHLEQLTDGNQRLGLDQRFQGDIFVSRF
jgi:uncharacterized caspase-like protein